MKPTSRICAALLDQFGGRPMGVLDTGSPWR